MREKLLTLPLAELRKIAKEQGLKAVSGYRKSELVDKLCELAGESVPKTEEASPKREESLPKTEEALPGTEEALPRAEEPAERAAAPERRRIIQRRPERMSTPRERAYPQSAPRPQERPQPDITGLPVPLRFGEIHPAEVGRLPQLFQIRRLQNLWITGESNANIF